LSFYIHSLSFLNKKSAETKALFYDIVIENSEVSRGLVIGNRSPLDLKDEKTFLVGRLLSGRYIPSMKN